MKKKNKKAIGFFVVLLLGLGVLAVINQPGLIYGPGGQTKFDNGRLAWIVDAYLSNLDSTAAKITFSTTEMQRSSDSAGNEMVPKDSETITIELTEKDCVYSVEPLYTIGNNGYYKVYNPQLDFTLKSTAQTTGTTRSFSLSKVQATEVVSAKRGGQITVAVTGVELKNYCYIPDNAKILKAGTKYSFLDSDKIKAQTTKTTLCSIGLIPGLVACYLTGIIDVDDVIDQGFYRNYNNIRFTSTQVKGEPIKALGSVHVIVTADKEYFDAQPVVTQAPVANPKIVSVLCPDVQTGREASMKVVVKNEGKTGDVEVELDGNLVDIVPDGSNTRISQGEQKTFYYVIKPDTVTSKKTYTIDVVASSQAQIGEGNQHERTCSGSIEPKSVIIPPKLPYCGNDKCEDTESTQTCPKDCKVQQCDPNKFEFLNEDSGKCECPEGYMRDDNSNCSEREGDNLLFYGLIALFVFAILAIVIARSGSGKKSGGALL